MSTRRNLTANRTLDRGELTAGASGQHVQALFGNTQQARETAMKRIRANAIKTARHEHGLQAAKRLKQAFPKLDFAVRQGYYSANAITGNESPLDFEEWRDADERVIPETQEVLTAVDDLIAAGFTKDVSAARTVSTWQVTNDFDDIAERSMDGRNRSTEDRTVKQIQGVPLPFVHVDYEISARDQMQSQNFGESLDTEDARKAGRAVREDLEDLMFNGWGVTVQTEDGGFGIGGYTTDSSRITGSAAGDWGTASNVLDTVDSMLADLEQQGPNNNEGYMPEQEGVWLYVPTAQWGELNRQADPRGDGNMSIRMRIEQDYPYIDIRHAGALDAGELVMVAQNQDVVDLANGQGVTNMSWEIEGGMATRYKTLALRVPRVKNTYAGRSGIVHYTGA